MTYLTLVSSTCATIAGSIFPDPEYEVCRILIWNPWTLGQSPTSISSSNQSSFDHDILENNPSLCRINTELIRASIDDPQLITFHPTMRFTSTSLLLAATLTSAQDVFQTRSSKRGLVFVPSPKHPSDNQIWVDNNSDLTWYYNYGPAASPAYSNRTQEEFEFVPMLWSPTTTFLNSVQSMIKSGTNISHILTYNEPDGTTSTGGSNLDPAVAATNWISQVQPLKKQGVKLGAPAVTGSPSGFTWLKEFFDSCASQGTNCTADFIPIHWYGNFAGLASHIGQVRGT